MSQERRVLTRFQIEMPVSLQMEGMQAIVPATTKDVSASGVFFYTNFELAPGADIEFTMTLPPELTHSTGNQVACKGKIVRVQSDPATGRVGVGAAIQSFEFVSAAASSGPDGA